MVEKGQDFGPGNDSLYHRYPDDGTDKVSQGEEKQTFLIFQFEDTG